MSNETKLNIFAKKNTVINTNDSVYPKFSLGAVIDGKYKVEYKIGGNSGEADLYKVVPTFNSIYAFATQDSKQVNNFPFMHSSMVLKLYRRKASVKKNVLDSLISIRNANVAEIIDFGEVEGFTYIVMPFYENGSLASYIESGNLFDVDAIKTVILPSIVDGLKAIHEEGIIHKDIKPSNLMVSNNQRHVVLIDFGISSATEGNTVVVTQTGKSPFYSAPETTTGLFLTESDYYSLGITLYELVTGYTPYQNANIDNIARYAQIQKIPYPDGFDKDLADLIDGLTYKDISNRHDKSNPNRRWGYEEIMKWIWGTNPHKLESEVLTGHISRSSAQNTSNSKTDDFDTYQNLSTIPYLFDGRKLYNNKDIVLAFLNSWEDGKKEVFRGYLARHYELTDNKEALKICRNFKNESNNSNVSIDLLFLKLMYLLEPSVKELFWQNYVFADLADCGNQLIDKALSSDDQAIFEFLKIAEDFIKQNVINIYLETHSLDINDTLQKLLISLKNLITTKEYDLRFIAFKLGHILTGREDFICAGTIYKNVNELNAYINNLYSTSFASFIDFCRDHSEEIDGCRLLFADKLTNQLNHNKTKDTIEFDGYIFDNFDCLLRYYNDLGNGQKEWIKNYRGVLNHFIKLVNDKSYQETILSTLKIKLSTVKGNISVGNSVMFGNYWQSSNDFKEPIEWLVLEVEDDKRALLISKYALDCKQYHNKFISITWEKCDLRKWLNKEFINNAFSKDEQNEIQITALSTESSNKTKDKIFLLSTEEVNKYFNSYEQRLCKPTKYAIINKAYKSDKGIGWWWLRSSGYDMNHASGIDEGKIINDGNVNGNGGAVRAVLWISLEPNSNYPMKKFATTISSYVGRLINSDKKI